MGSDHISIFLPVVVQILLTLVVFVALGVAKGRALKTGAVDEKRRALFEDAWPESVIKINNNIRNQFQLPVLFYVLAIVLWLLGAAGVFAVVVAWLFVLSRVVHAYIHIGINYVPARRRAFMFGAGMVMIMAVQAIGAILAA
jgi:hypothetical protein